MFGERNTKAIKDFFLYNKKDAATTESIRLEGIRQLKEQRYIEANGGYFLTRVPEYAIDKFDEYPYAVLTNIVDTESRQDVPVTFATCEFICKTHEEAEEKAAMLQVLMDHYHPARHAGFNPAAIPRTAVFKLKVESINGKRKELKREEK